MKEISNKQKVDEIFSRGVGEFVDPDGKFREKLEKTPKEVVIKFGVDPTRPDIHLGHAVVLRKLRQFQDLGCKVVFLVGDYTAQIGDPTGKSKIRPEIQLTEILNNMKTYLDQVVKILRTEEGVFSWIKNSDWFTDVSDIALGTGKEKEIKIKVGDEEKTYPNTFAGKAQLLDDTRMQKTHLKNSTIYTTSLSRVLGTLRHITFSRLSARSMFRERIDNKEELYMHEMLYPVLQGIDSSVLALIYGTCDIEVGGTDQTFNMLMGRDIMKMYNQPEQAVLAFKILEGTDGKEKMSKSLDNYIGITDEPNDMYGKVMSIPDSSIVNYFELCTFTPMEEIEEIKKKLEKNSVNPKDLKMNLAKQIVAIYHGEDKAQKAEENFVNTFQKGEIPEEMIELQMEKEKTLMDLLVETKILSSKSDFRRLIEEGAISNLDTSEKTTDANFIPKSGMKFKIGKRKFVRIK